MNFALLCVFTGTLYVVMGGLLLMLAHGFTSSGLFFIVGCLYDRFHTRTISDLGGLAMYMPNFSTLYFIFTLANISFPFTLNFAGEFLIFLGLVNAKHYCFLLPAV
jgi:NADH-quinone oxidoreductase subunit M